MKSLSCQEIRNKWIEYFTKKCERKHSHTRSASLIPDNPTLLLNAAGMVQFVPYFLGTKKAPEPPRTITIQKCVRVGGKDSDLENIGRTSRHHSFFEMLGNFSFGDYFKQEAINWAWEFVTEELGLEKEKLFVSIFAGDDQNAFDEESHKIWTDVLKKDGINDPEVMIKRMGRKDNFWGPPGTTGPCGPCSEIHYDRGDHIKDEDERFLEVWNLVFMEFDKDEEGKFSPLENKNIDTGAGLERIAMILQGKNNTFETNELFGIIQEIVSLINKETGSNLKELGNSEELDLQLKIIADHIRCAAFLIADGVRPSNLGRGYVLRMIIRRAARFAFLLRSKPEAFLYQLTNKVVGIYGEAYPELKENKDTIKDVCQKEEEQFAKTIIKGLTMLDEEMSKVKDKTLCGDFVFDLYSTYGFPLEITQDIAEEKGYSINLKQYEKAKEKHSEASNTGAFSVSVLNNKEIPKILKEHGETKFLGYEDLNTEAKILAIIDHEGKRLESLDLGSLGQKNDDNLSFELVLDQTTFYAESGGQVGDVGLIKVNGAEIKITDTKKVEGIFLHHASANATGTIKAGDSASAEVDPEMRRLSKAHHSTCHLLQSALKQVLGDQVQQAGSQVGPDYTRFDFNFERGMTKDEIKKTEDIINKWIKEEHSVKAEEMSFDDAMKAGALAFFEDKYGDKVRVLTMGSASIELCGGTHVSNIKEIGQVKVASEGSVAAGIRRIKLFASDKAIEFAKEQAEKEEQARLEQEAQEKAKQEAKAKKAELKAKAMEQLDSLVAEAEDIAGNKILIKEIPGLDGDSLRSLTEAARDKLQANGSVVIMLATKSDDNKAVFIAAVSDALSKTFNAGQMVKTAAQICQGGGGGRPNFAQAGGKDGSKIPEALNAVRESLQATK